MNDKYFAIKGFLQLTDELRSVIMQGDPMVDGSLKTGGEMLELWLACLPRDVKKHMVRTNPKYATLFKELG